MDAAQALADLTEISSQIRAAAIFEDAGVVVGSTLDEEGGKRLADAARRLLEEAERVRGEGEPRLTQLEAATREGSVFVVRDGERAIAAATTAEPTVGLVFYDLKSCLRQLAAESEQPTERAPKRTRAARKKPDAEPEPEPDAAP